MAVNRTTAIAAGVAMLFVASLVWAVDHYKGRSETAAQQLAAMSASVKERDRRIAKYEAAMLEQERNMAVQRASAIITDAALLKQKREQAEREEAYALREQEFQRATAGDGECADYLSAPVAACVHDRLRR